jgi:hypothetical protein
MAKSKKLEQFAGTSQIRDYQLWSEMVKKCSQPIVSH